MEQDLPKSVVLILALTMGVLENRVGGAGPCRVDLPNGPDNGSLERPVSGGWKAFHVDLGSFSGFKKTHNCRNPCRCHCFDAPAQKAPWKAR